MGFIQQLMGQSDRCMRRMGSAALSVLLLGMAAPAAQAQMPAAGASCTVSALNVNAPVEPDGAFTLFNVPGGSGPFRARATCSDGTVGQTRIAFPVFAETLVFTDDIVWGRIDPTPVALGLSAAARRLSLDQTAQLRATAVADNASTRDVTPQVQGTTYSISNPLLASVTPDGLVQVLPLFASGASARVVAAATNEGGVAASYMFILGPRGTLSGKVTRADGVTAVANAQVSVIRSQPMEQVGTVATDASGSFNLPDVNAGSFTLSVIDPATGDRGRASARIEAEGEQASANIALNGQGQVVVTVLDAAGRPVGNASVTVTALGPVSDTRTLNTDALGRASFDAFPAGDFTASTRDPVSRLIGTAVGFLPVGAVLPVALKLQPVGSIGGRVLGVDGASVQEGVQVRILSRERGILTQVVTAADGQFLFDTLPIGDGPFTLDAFVDGRLRARVPGIVLSSPNQQLTQDLRFTSVGTVRGLVTDAGGKPFAAVSLSLQSLEGLRLSFTASAGADGAYLVQGVPVGNYTIAAVTPDGRSGSASGRIAADGDNVTSNIAFAAGGLTGTVFLRDGVTPAGAGVKVFLQRDPSSSQQLLTLSDDSPAVTGVASTNSLGQFSFPIALAGSYVVQVQDGDNRGRSQAAITTIVAGSPATVNVAFLGKSSVSGTVRDGAGVVQPGSKVVVRSVGAFTNAWETLTDASGRYAVPNVFVGDIVVTAQHIAARLTGISNGRMIFDGNNLSLDVTLAATGTVQGRVLKSDGSAAVAPFKLDLYAGTSLIATQLVATGNNFVFALVPLGEVRVVATETASGDQGMATSKLIAANEVRSLDVKLTGQGVVRVSVTDADGKPVAGATVAVRSQSGFANDVTLLSDSAGVAVAKPVFNGDFTVNVSKAAQLGQITGSAQGTIVNGATMPVAVVLTSQPVGRITGTVFRPNGVDPAAGMVVSLSPAPAGGAYQASTDAHGVYVLDNIEDGRSYALSARNSNPNPQVPGRVRAQVANLQISTQGQVITQNLQVIGAGSVSGTVKRASGQAVGGVKVSFANLDAVYGGRYETTTDADGRYLLADMPAGNFTLLAVLGTLETGLRAEGGGRIGFDADAIQVDLTLVDAAIAMPRTLMDANAMPFDVTGDGSVASGKNGIFTGTGPEARGMRLDILVNGVAVPFRNGDGSIGRLLADGQQIDVDEVHASGLNVTRRVYVPKTGYFARYLEVLENRTAAPITVDVRVSTHHSQSNSNPRVVDTSDGDDVLSIGDPVNRDRWLVVDDQQDADPFLTGSAPATGHVFDGANARLQAGAASYELVGQTGKLVLQWQSVTVQPGETRALMHFAFSQLDRYRAREAALRLAALAPETIAGLAADERAAVLNFAIPADGIGAVAALPAIDSAIVRGRVLSGDGITPVANATVHFKSKHALFGRDFTATADAAGDYRFAARMDGTAAALPLPLFGFDIDARHPATNAPSSASVNDFPAGVTDLVQDLSFNGTGNLRGTVLRPGGALVADAAIELKGGTIERYVVRSGPDGSYLLSGLPPGQYRLAVSKQHPQQDGGCCGIEGLANPVAFAGSTTVTAITLEEVGSVTGIVRSAGGAPVVGARLALYDNAGRQTRVTVSDTAGRYRFSDVKLGAGEVEARDAVSAAAGRVAFQVVKDTETVADIGLRGFGTINVQVNFARGIAAPGAQVTYDGINFRQADQDGRLSYSLPVGNYPFTASHPDNPQEPLLIGKISVTLAGNGDITPATISLGGAGSVRGTILRPGGATPANGFPYTIKLLNGANTAVRNGRTDAVGQFQIFGVPLGASRLTAFDPDADRFVDTEVTLAADGAEAVVELVVEPDRIALPAALFDANRYRFDVQNNAGLASGSDAFDGAAILEVNGAVFTGATSAALEVGKRQFAVAQEATMSGLKVTRKIFVPRGAYFARYLEVFDNPGATTITVRAGLRTGYRQAQLFGSSSGAAVPGALDDWLVLDDQADMDNLVDGGQPATAHVHGQPGAALHASQVALSAGAGQSQQLLQQWGSVRVPAGAKVALLHFVVQQVNRNGARASAERLAQLPPEALDGLTPAEAAAIVNFRVPLDNVSVVPALPSLTESLSGQVFEGDGVTTVNNVKVTVQSAHPLFNRVWGLVRDSYCEMAGTAVGTLASNTVTNDDPSLTRSGVYSVQGVLSDRDSIALPAGIAIRLVAQEPIACFGLAAGHPLTHMPSRVVALPGAATNQPLLFDSGILTGTVSGPPGLGVTTGRVWRSFDDPDAEIAPFYVPIAADGTYLLPGLVPGNYDMMADVPHPQGSKLRGERLASAVALGRTTVTDIVLQKTGGVRGTVITANGEPSVNALVTLSGAAADQEYDACAGCAAAAPAGGRRAIGRTTRTDTLGRYNFNAVPVGAYAMTAIDPVSQAQIKRSLSVGDGQDAIHNVTLLTLGSVRLSVNSASGAPAADASVYVRADAEGVEKVAGRTNGGKLTIANVPFGNYRLRVVDPRFLDDRRYDQLLTGTISDTLQQDKAINLLAVAGIRVITQDGDAGNGKAILANAAVRLDAIDKGTSNADGTLLLPALVAGQYQLSATRELEGRVASGQGQVTIGVAEDNQVIDAPLAIMRSFGSAVVTALDTDHGNAALPDAHVFLKLGNGAKVEVGVTGATGSLRITGIAPGAYQITVAALVDGRTEQLVVSGTISALNIGQTQVHTAPFRRSLLVQRVLTFNEERHLYSVALQAGDRLSTSIKGAVVDGVAASYRMRAEVFDGAFNSPASGYGTGPEGAYRQGNYNGDLAAVTAARAGSYTIAISMDAYAPKYLGGYELGVSINGVPQAPQPYADSGVVAGTLLRSDGVTPVANTKVRIAAAGGSGMQTEVSTDAAGKYLFAVVPLGEFVLSVTPANLAATVAGTLSERGATVTANLRLLAATTVNVTVKNLDGTPAASGLVYYNNDGSTRFATAGGGRTDEQGRLSFVVTGNTRIFVYASGNSSMVRSAITPVEPNDNIAATVNLTIGSATLSGQALTAAGTPFTQGQVQVRLASADAREGALWSQYVDNMGRFTIPEVPAFQELLVQVRNIYAPSTAPGMTRVMSRAGEPIADVIVRMPGKATLTSSVRYSTGRPVANVRVGVSWFNTYDPSAGISGTSDANGLIRMADLPSEIPITFALSIDTVPALTLNLVNGETRVLPDFVIEVGAVLKAQLRTPGNDPLPDYACDFSVEAGNYSRSGQGPCNEAIAFQNVPPGPALVRIGPQGRSAYGSVVVNAVDKVETAAEVWVATVRGTVRYQGGAAVPYPSVYLLDSAGEMRVPVEGTGDDGGYAIHGVRQGPFTIVAQDQNGLTGSAPGNLADATAALAQDVTLPPSATVAGRVTDADGNPVANAAVYLQHPEQDQERYDSSDADGNYRFDKVSLGQVQVSAVGAGQGPAAVSARLDEPDQVHTVDLHFPLPGSVSGKVVAADGVTPLAAAAVQLTAAEASAAYGGVQLRTSTDSAGAFTFASAPVGLLRVDAVAANGSVSATGTVMLASGANALLNLQAGAARALPITLASSLGYDYTVNEDGSLDASKGGYSRTVGYYGLAVSGLPFGANALATLVQGGSEVQLGPRNHAGLAVVRRVYVPPAGAYVRLFDSLTNTTGADIETVVRIASPAMQGPDGPMQIGLLGAGPGYAIYSAPDYGVNRDSSVMTVFNGAASLLAPGSKQFNVADGSFRYAWTLRIPARKTVSLMHFTSLTVNASLATALAQALAAGTDPAMFNGLSAADKASIHNFTVTQ